MPCEHRGLHQTTQEAIDCSLSRIADVLEALYEKLPDVSTPKDLLHFLKQTVEEAKASETNSDQF